MKFNAVNNQERRRVLSVSGQCCGLSAVTLACTLCLYHLYVLCTAFPGGHSLSLEFGLFFYPYLPPALQESFTFEDEDDYEYEIFSILSSARS